MQYEVTLPADYDMSRIRARVAANGHLLDSYPGLGVKAFLIRERGVNGSAQNQYAPFYLWADASGAASFLWSPFGFSAITRDFGRPAVRTWVGGTAHGGAVDATARFASRLRRTIGDDEDLVAVAAAADRRAAQAALDPHVVLSSYAIDPERWELVIFTLHTDEPDRSWGTLYEVLHVSQPERDDLPTRVAPRAEPA